MPTSRSDRKAQVSVLRFGLTGLSVLMTVGLLGLVLYRYFSIDLRTLPSLRWNGMVEAAIQLQVSQSSTWFQILLLVVAALLGLLIARRDEAGLLWDDEPEIVMFACATLLLLASVSFHLLFLDQVQAAYLDGGMVEGATAPALPDPLAPSIDALFRSQRDCFIVGSVIALLTFFSAHRLRG